MLTKVFGEHVQLWKALANVRHATQHRHQCPTLNTRGSGEHSEGC